MTGHSRLLCAVLLVACGGLAAGPPPAPEPPSRTLSEEEAVLLQPTLSGRPLGDGLQAFRTAGSALLPLGELCRLLGLGIVVEAAEGRAGGFFISPSRTFTLDAARREAQVEGRVSPFGAGQVVAFQGDLYVEATLLERWLPVDITLAYRDSGLVLKAREPLPVQAAWDRDQAGLRDLARKAGRAAPALPRHPFPYAFATVPMADLSVAWSATQHAAGGRPAASISLGGDLLWMSAQGMLAQDATGSSRANRFTLFREDPNGGLLWPLRANRISLGDLRQAVGLELAGSLPLGRGISVDNYATAFRSAFAERAFSGVLPEGWTVELYQNNGLIGFQRSRADGTYQFPAVPLRFGLNLFRLVFHGPLGQQREERYRLDIDQDRPEPGQVFYRVTGLRPTQAQFSTDPALPVEGLERPAYLAEAEYGLSTFLSAKAGAMSLHAPAGAHRYSVAGLRAAFPFLSLELMGAADRQADAASSRPQGLAAGATLRTGYEYSSLQASRTEYRRGFMPTAQLFAGPLIPDHLRVEDRLNAFGTLPGSADPLGLSYLYQRQAYQEGGSLRRHRLQATLTRQRFSASQAISHVRDTTRNQDLTNLESSTMASVYLNDWQANGSIQVLRARGRISLSGWTATGSTRTPSGIAATVGVRGGTGGLAQANWFASAMSQGGRIGYGIEAAFSRAAGWSAGLRLQLSVGREPRTGRWITDAQPLAGLGAVSARAFLDADYNGILDPGERILHGVQFRIAESEPKDRGLDPSVAVYTQVAVGAEADIDVDTATLEDASHQPEVPAIRVLPRPGTFLPLDYPIAAMGEVNGTTRLRTDGQSQEIAGVEVELVDEAGRQVQVQRSAYDGFFEFRNLRPGAYLLRVTPREVQRLKLALATERSFRVELQKTCFDGLDLSIAYQTPARPAGPAPSDKPVP